MGEITKSHSVKRARIGAEKVFDVLTAGFTRFLPGTGQIEKHTIKLKDTNGHKVTVEGKTRREVESKAFHAHRKLKRAK